MAKAAPKKSKPSKEKTVPKKSNAAQAQRVVQPPPMPASPFNGVKGLPDAGPVLNVPTTRVNDRATLADSHPFKLKPGELPTDIVASQQKLATVTPIAPKIEKTPQRQRRNIVYGGNTISKVVKKLGDIAVSALEEMNEAAMRAYLTDLAIHEEEVEMAKANDEQLKEAKESASEHAAPYRDSLNGIKARRRWIVSTMQTRGYVL